MDLPIWKAILKMRRTGVLSCREVLLQISVKKTMVMLFPRPIIRRFKIGDEVIYCTDNIYCEKFSNF